MRIDEQINMTHDFPQMPVGKMSIANGNYTPPSLVWSTRSSADVCRSTPCALGASSRTGALGTPTSASASIDNLESLLGNPASYAPHKPRTTSHAFLLAVANTSLLSRINKITDGTLEMQPTAALLMHQPRVFSARMPANLVPEVSDVWQPQNSLDIMSLKECVPGPSAIVYMKVVYRHACHYPDFPSHLSIVQLATSGVQKGAPGGKNGEALCSVMSPGSVLRPVMVDCIGLVSGIFHSVYGSDTLDQLLG
ncbi:hypothetical protein PR048_018429 [Dryococelus australis]|uniref:Uncharacterized protein n=1 Tax=Dryococelus australis TaxID=614101 RepID=A0ABQ9HC87_9NEOP|nr:hypothetical protein PR048_018429 [Dryococelus australis]